MDGDFLIALVRCTFEYSMERVRERTGKVDTIGSILFRIMVEELTLIYLVMRQDGPYVWIIHTFNCGEFIFNWDGKQDAFVCFTYAELSLRRSLERPNLISVILICHLHETQAIM